MEIRQQCVDARDRLRRVDEDVGLTLLRDDPPGGVARAGLQHAHRRRAHRHDPAARAGGAVDRVGRPRFDLETLDVHAVRAQVLGLHRLERPDADVQRDERVRHPREDRRGEVQPGRRRGDRARHVREDRLVTLGVRRLGLAPEVRRQRHRAVAFQVDLALEADDAFALFARQHALDHTGGFADADGRADAGFAAGFDEADPERRFRALDDEELEHAAVDGVREDARRDHAGVVEHGEVAGTQVVGEIRERAVLDAPGGAVQDHHARGGAFGGRVTRDEMLGQRVVVVAREQHGGDETSRYHDSRRVPPVAPADCRLNKDAATTGRVVPGGGVPVS